MVNNREKHTSSSERTIALGVLGCSDIARRRFIPAAARLRDARVTAVGTRRIAEMRQRPELRSCVEVLSYEELLACSDVEVLYISLPNDLHEYWTLAALDSGKHVICEKPLGLSASSVDAMVNRAEERGLLLYENIMYLHHPLHRILKELVVGGKLGRIRSLRAWFGFTLKSEAGFRRDPDRGGGAFHDLARYPLSAALYYLQGVPQAFDGEALYRGKLNLAMKADAMTELGELFLFSIGFEQPYVNRLELEGELGTARVERPFTIPADMPNSIALSIGSREETVHVPAADHFTGMIEAVCALVRSEDRAGFSKVHRSAARLARLADTVQRQCTVRSAGPCDRDAMPRPDEARMP